MPRSALIIGGDCVLGLELAAALNSAGISWYATTRRTWPEPSQRRPFLDLREPDDAKLPMCETIFLLAGITGEKRCKAAGQSEAWRVNVAANVRLARTQLDYNVGKVVFVSSHVAENSPTSMYGSMKLEVETALTHMNPGRTAIVRFGPIEWPGHECKPVPGYMPVRAEPAARLLANYAVIFHSGLMRVTNQQTVAA